MAYLTHISPTCPTCGISGSVRIVVGTGPASRPGSKPYRRWQDTGPFTAETDAQGRRTGRLLCPTDGAPVWSDTPGGTT